MKVLIKNCNDGRCHEVCSSLKQTCQLFFLSVKYTTMTLTWDTGNITNQGINTSYKKICLNFLYINNYIRIARFLAPINKGLLGQEHMTNDRIQCTQVFYLPYKCLLSLLPSLPMLPTSCSYLQPQLRLDRTKVQYGPQDLPNLIGFPLRLGLQLELRFQLQRRLRLVPLLVPQYSAHYSQQQRNSNAHVCTHYCPTPPESSHVLGQRVSQQDFNQTLLKRGNVLGEILEITTVITQE